MKFFIITGGILLFSLQNLFSQIDGLPLDLEVGYRRWAIFGNVNLNSKLSKLDLHDLPVGGALCIGDVRKARKGYNSPTINKFISISISPGTITRNFINKDRFFDRLGLGRFGIVNFCYKINRMKANQEKSFTLNNYYFEGSFDYINPSGTNTTVDTSGSTMSSEQSTTSASIQCFNLTVGYELMLIRTISGHSIQDTKGKIMFSIQPKIFGYHVIKGSDKEKVYSIAETYSLMTDNPDQDSNTLDKK